MLLSAVILAVVSVRHRWQLLGRATRAIGRLPRLHTWVSDKQPIIDSAEDNLLSFRDEAPAAFWATLIFNLLWHMLAILEVYIALRFMGAKVAQRLRRAEGAEISPETCGTAAVQLGLGRTGL